MFFGDSKGFLGHLRDFLDFQGSLGFSLNSQGSSDFFSRFLGWCTRFLLVIHPSSLPSRLRWSLIGSVGLFEILSFWTQAFRDENHLVVTGVQ